MTLLRRTTGLVLAAAFFSIMAACTAADDPGGSGTADTSGATAPSGDAGSRSPRFAFDGPETGALINADGLEELSFTVRSVSGTSLDAVRLVLDGVDVTPAVQHDAETLTYTPDQLDDGPRTLAVHHTGGVEDGGAAAATTRIDVPATRDGFGGATGDGSVGAAGDGSEGAAGESRADQPLHTWQFEVKATPPTFELTSPEGSIGASGPVTLRGRTDPEATVAVGDHQVRADADGRFELEIDDGTSVHDGDGELVLTVTDEAGNRREVTHTLPVVASRVETDEIRTVHAASWAWHNAELREPMLQMLADGKINAMQIDLKDEAGHLGYDSEVELAHTIGAVKGPLDLEQTVADLHDDGVPVIGRIVAFADPTLASWAWENGRRDWVIQTNDGTDYYRGRYAGFANYTHPDVIAYNLEIAAEAARAGVDHILWDYVRRPEGIDNYTVPGLTTTPEEAIVDFVRQADERLSAYGIEHGASVYGIAVDRPTQIGQDIQGMAEHLDYVAPMLYPSHWGPWEYGVENPNRQPYDIISEALKVWNEATADKRARVVPWLEDTPYRAWDRPHQVREQLRAAAEYSDNEWLMWHPGSTFTPEVYPRVD